MINGDDFYNVMSALVPLYVAMLAAYASVRWWKIFTPEQCSGINRFVAAFAVPLLSFHFISSNNPYKMNLLFVAADTIQKGALLLLLGSSAALLRRPAALGSTPLEWLITVFSLATLPNTLVIGIPLLVAMYGEPSGAGALMVQVVVLQSIVWYTLLLLLFELRAAKALISGNFPDTAAGIASIEVESDVISLHGDRLETEPHVGPDGRLRVTIRRSGSSALAGAEIYSLSSAESRGSNFVNYGFEDLYSDHGSVGSMTTPRPSVMMARSSTGKRWYPSPSSELGVGGRRSYKRSRSAYREMQRKGSYGGRELHMFRWSARESPTTTEFGRLHLLGGGGLAPVESCRDSTDGAKEIGSVGFDRPQINQTKEGNQQERKDSVAGGEETVAAGKQMPPTSVMTKLIVVMVCRKLLRNPNTYASILGLVWSLISYRWDLKMPKIVANSISILSNTGLGMAMFSLGLFMAMQPKLIACGKSLALFSMAVRFIVGPAVMAVASVAVGIRGNLLRISILQAALPQGIVPFVFAKEYNNHPTILSTAVIFGMIVALPVDILYYILLGL